MELCSERWVCRIATMIYLCVIMSVQGDVMICMELMDKSLHALYRLVYEQLHQSIPLPVLGKMAESVSE